MKKIYSIAIMLLLCTLQLHAQSSQRLVLIEEHSVSWCVPSAVQNPAFFSLMNVNKDKAVLLYYPIWGPDPTYSDNTAEADARGSYNSISSVPKTLIDGTKPNNSYCGGCGTGTWGSNPGNPSGYTQDVLDFAASVLSPFTIEVSADVDVTDSIIVVTMAITATDAFVGSSDLKARIAVVEEHISWASPLANGETELYNVMKKFLPGADGISIRSSWLPGDTLSITESWDFASWPGNIYDLGQLSVVCFIQDDTSKVVHQAGYAEATFTGGNTNDAAANTIDANAPVVCGNSLSSVVEIINYGGDTLTSVEINYQINGETINVYNWTGSLKSYEKKIVALPLTYFTPTGGTNILDVWTSNPNGIPDEDASNDQATQHSFTEAPVADNTSMAVEVKTDGYGSEISWKIFQDGVTAAIDSGDGYGNNEIVSTPVNLDVSSCYVLVAYDSWGDGILDSGYIKLINDSDDVLTISGGSYAFESSAPFKVVVPTGVKEVLAHIILSVYPNPSGGRFTIAGITTERWKVFNSQGKLVKEGKGNEVNLDGHAGGMYLLQVGEHTEQLILK